MTNDGVYLKEVEITDVKCFKGTHKISFAKPNGEPQQWNVILGNNNTGKTTILKALASLRLERRAMGNPVYYIPKGDICHEITTSSYSVISKFSTEFPPWGFKVENSEFEGTTFLSHMKYVEIIRLRFIGYGISRKMQDSNLYIEEKKKGSIAGIFDNNIEYTNIEEWLLQLDYGIKNGIEQAALVYKSIKDLLLGGILPDVKDIELISEINDNSVQNYALFHTDYGKVRLRELGYGYQSTMVWVVDLAKKMFEHFYELENPLHGSVICLVDEIDLHLHPDWQRKIIKYLSGVFPNVQFIVTAHSPLIVQSAEDVNLIILEKDKENTHIRQEFGTFQGWTVEEILQDLMGLGDKILSDKYLEELKKFEKGIDEEDYEKAKSAFNELDKILHPTSSQRKLLRLQLGSIAPRMLAYA